jgi:hypothetical protein
MAKKVAKRSQPKTELHIEGFEALQREVGKSKILEVAYSHLSELRAQQLIKEPGRGFTLDFSLHFTLFGLAV